MLPFEHSTILNRQHDKYLDRYKKTRIKRIIGEQRDKSLLFVQLCIVFGVKKNGMEFPIVLKVSELSFGSETVYVGVIKNVSYEQDLLNIRYVQSLCQ